MSTLHIHSPLPAPVLERYLAGDATGEDLHVIQAWIHANHQAEQLLQALQARYQPYSAPLDPGPGWAAVQARLREPAVRTPAPALRQGSRWRSSLGTALVAAGAGVALFWIGVDRAVPSRQFFVQEYTTRTGQQATLHLLDGSRVQLAPGTKLRAVVDAHGERQLDIQGEAYVTVVPQADHPFIVTTGSITTTVLGTAFSIRHDPVSRQVQVAVADGKVAAQSGGDPVILTPGMSGLFTDSGATVRTDINPHAVAEWTRGRLVFTRVPVPEMLATVGRWYGYAFQLADSTLASQHVSAVIAIGQPDQMKKTLQALLSVTMTFQDSVVILRRDDAGTRRHVPVPSRYPRDTAFLSQREIGK